MYAGRSMGSRRSRHVGIEERLEQLSALLDGPETSTTKVTLREALTSRHAVIVAKAATIASRVGAADFEPELTAAFDRLLENPIQVDKGCLGKIAIAKAVDELDLLSCDLFLRGVRHVQMEPAWGPPIDTAVELRAVCGLGLVSSGCPLAALELVPLLVDTGPAARLAAIQGLAALRGPESEGLLRLKLLTGDEDAEVLTECCTALLRLEPARSLDFLRPYLEPPASDVRSAVILALGESRLEQAVPMLREVLESSVDRESRRVVLLALASSRRPAAIDHLLSLITDETSPVAAEAIAALAIHRHDARICARMREAVEGSAHREDLLGTLSRELGC